MARRLTALGLPAEEEARVVAGVRRRVPLPRPTEPVAPAREWERRPALQGNAAEAEREREPALAAVPR